MNDLIHIKQFEESKQLQELLEQSRKIPERYAGDIGRFRDYASGTQQPETIATLLNYLAHSMTQEGIKKTTWERRLAAAKKYLAVTHDLHFTDEDRRVIADLRKVYSLEDYKEKTHIEGQPAADKAELMDMIEKMDPRARAICLVNLVTANRPSEMVRMKIEDFNFTSRSVRIYLKKQKEWHTKRLTQEVIKAVKEYIKAYGLKKDDHFVGRVRKGGRYENVQIGEVAYNKMIHRYLGFAPYTLRKTQVSAMHEKGADLPAIAKQTGHRSLETLSKHYLKVNDTTIDKYL